MEDLRLRPAMVRDGIPTDHELPRHEVTVSKDPSLDQVVEEAS